MTSPTPLEKSLYRPFNVENSHSVNWYQLTEQELEGTRMICLDDLFKLNLKNWIIHSLAFSDTGNLGVATDKNCAYVFDPNGNLLNKICEKYGMFDASYCYGKFGFANGGGYAYITDENGSLIKKIDIGHDYDSAITMKPNGFVACSYKCAFFDFNGKKKWDVEVGFIANGPSYYKGYWYVADSDWKKLIIIKDGKIVNSKRYGEYAYDTAVCGKYLAVVTKHHLYLYDLSNPENPSEIWEVGEIAGGYQVAFSLDCKYIAVAEWDEHKLKIYSIFGNLVLEKYYGEKNKDIATAVAWWRDRIAVGLYDGRVYVHSVKTLGLPFPLLPANSVTKTSVRGRTSDLS